MFRTYYREDDPAEIRRSACEVTPEQGLAFPWRLATAYVEQHWDEHVAFRRLATAYEVARERLVVAANTALDRVEHARALLRRPDWFLHNRG